MQEKIIVKLSYPSKWDDDWGLPMFLTESPELKSIWGSCKFEINNDTVDCDYWIVYEDINLYLFEFANCPKENCIFITGEESTMWNYSEEFLAQFGIIFTSRDDIRHPNVIYGHYVCPWHVKRSYDSLDNLKEVSKSEMLSAICSNTTYLEGHKKRYALVNRLKGHFKDRMHWYGRGENPIYDKWDGLIKYKYSIAIENASHKGYWTEKIADCFLTYTMPIYWGCPNIEDYFPSEAFIKIDIDDYKTTIEDIEQAIECNLQEKNFKFIEDARKLVLNKYQIFPVVTTLVNRIDIKFKRKMSKSLIRSKAFYSNKFTFKQQAYIYKRSAELFAKGYR